MISSEQARVAGRAAARPLAAERLDAIRRLARARHVVRVEDLIGALGASAATVRRDLEALEARGEVRRVHGGAVAVEDRLVEPVFDAKAEVAAPEKRAIAAAALAHVGEGDTIYLDGGSTVLELARRLHERPGVTVVTNSLRAALELAGQGPRLFLVGGELRRLSQTLVGPLTRRVLAEVHVDKAFMGTIGLSEREGLSTTDPAEAFTKEQVMAQAREVFLLADARKWGQVSFARAGGLGGVHRWITAGPVPPGCRGALRRHGVRLEVAAESAGSAAPRRGSRAKANRPKENTSV